MPLLQGALYIFKLRKSKLRKEHGSDHKPGPLHYTALPCGILYHHVTLLKFIKNSLNRLDTPMTPTLRKLRLFELGSHVAQVGSEMLYSQE